MTKDMVNKKFLCGLLISGFCLAMVSNAFADDNSNQALAEVQAQATKIAQLSQKADKILEEQQQISTELEQIRYWIR